MLSVSTPRKRQMEDDGLERISSINISCPRGTDAINTPPKKSRATVASPAQIDRPSFFPLGQHVDLKHLRHRISSCLYSLIIFSVDAASLSCETSDMPALHRKSARMRLESASAAPSSAVSNRSGESSDDKLYSNADVSKMVKEAVTAAVAHTKDAYEKILQEKLAGLFCCVIPFVMQPIICLIMCCRFQSNTSSLCASTKTISAAP